MAITPDEIGLTQTEWDNISNQVTHSIFQVDIYKWYPVFSSSVTGDATAYDHDAIQANGTIYLANSDEVRYLNATSFDILGSYSPATNQKTSRPPSLVYSGSTLYVFALTSSGISLRTYNGSWSSWTEIITDSTIDYIAATDENTLHYITHDTTNKHYHFKVAINDGGWSIDNSDIYWGFEITSFAAKRLGNKDILSITSTLPGTSSTKSVGTKLVKYYTPTGGVISFVYQYNSWSDHNVIDFIDQYSNYRYREHVKMSVINNYLWLTCYSSDGIEGHPITGYRFYRSKDGLHWSRGEVINVPLDSPFGITPLLLDTTLYLMTRDKFFTATSTLLFETVDLSNYINLTPYIHKFNIGRKDIQQISLSVDNSNNWMDSTFINGNYLLALKFSTGFTINGENYLVPIGVYELDTIEPNEENPRRYVNIVARDRFAWMSTRSQAEQFVYWDPQHIGVDDYVDSSGTGYGGLTHTAPFKGSYKAESTTLQLKSSNYEGVAASTFLNDNWNGSIDCHFQLSMLANDENAGVFFRGQDKDNLFYWRYKQADDKLHFGKRVANVDTDIWTSSAKGWSGTLATWTLRVEFRYSRIRLYSGDNQAVGFGVLWNLEQSLLTPGADPIENGYVGTLGKGYSAQDEWEITPDPLSLPIILPDYPIYIYLYADFDYA